MSGGNHNPAAHVGSMTGVPWRSAVWLKAACVPAARAVQGADPWAADNLGGRAALHYASRRNNPEIVQLLVDAAGSRGPVRYPNRPNTRSVEQ